MIVESEAFLYNFQDQYESLLSQEQKSKRADTKKPQKYPIDDLIVSKIINKC